MASKAKPPTCCYCCHVKIGTFMLAVLFLAGGLLGVVVSSLFLSNAIAPEQLFPRETFDDDVLQQFTETKRSTLWIGLGNGLFVTLIAVLAIYGLMKERAGFLLPLFIVQLFNYLCTVVYIGSVMFYWSSLKQSILMCPHLPEDWKNWLIQLDDRWLALIVFTIFFIILLIKSYLISMVYRCYKHFTMQAVSRQRRNTQINAVSDIEPGNGSIYKPPKYEDIQKVPLVSDVEEIDVKPPPYAA